MAQATITTERPAKAKPSQVVINDAPKIPPVTDEDHQAYVARRKPTLDQLGMLASTFTHGVTPELIALTEAHLAAYVERDMLREVPRGYPGHEQWSADVERLDAVETAAMHTLLGYHARRPEDIAYRAKYLMLADQSSDIFHMYGDAGGILLQSMADALNPSTTDMLSIAFETSESNDPEVKMSWLVRAFRDAAMLIDPTIRGFWISNSVGDDEVPAGATTFGSLIFDRRKSLKADFPSGAAYKTYLASDKLEMLDLSELGIEALIGLFKSLDNFRSATDTFLSAAAFHTFDNKGNANGSTWNGEMAEAIRTWADDNSSRIVEAIRAFTPANVAESYARAIFLIWWEAELGGELNYVLSIVRESATEQARLASKPFGEPNSVALSLMAEFGTLPEAEQEQLLAVARDLAAQKKAA